MNLEARSATLTQRGTSLRLKRGRHILLDFIVLSLIIGVTSTIIWGDFRRFLLPEIGLPVLAIVTLLPIAKAFIIKSQADRFRRVSQLTMSVMLTYAGIAVFLLLSRGYYSRPFLISTFLMILAWQIFDTFAIAASYRPQLIAVPSTIVDRLRSLTPVGLRILQRPKLDRAAKEIDGVVVDLHEPLEEEWRTFIAECAASGIPIFHAAAIHEAVSGKVALSLLHDGWIADLFTQRKRYLTVKRLMDITISVLALPLVAALSLVIAVLIKIDSPGPVIYRQARVGQGGVPFQMLKFRSMVHESKTTGASFTADHDPRVTRVGHFLRRYRLDELPQIWNVFKGEMSIIGPRPEQVVFAKEFAKAIPFYDWRHHLKPGITGWAQVQLGYTDGINDTREKTEYDLYYVKHVSFWFDVTILLLTVRTILTGGGAR